MSTNLGKFAAIGFLGTLLLAGCSSDDDPSPNRKPTAKVTAEQNAKVNKDVVIDGAASSDPEKQPLTFKWKLKKQPEGSTPIKLDEAKENKVTIKPSAPGSYEVELTVSDGALTDTASVNVNVTAEGENGTPTAKIEPISSVFLVKKDVVTLDGSKSTDPDEADKASLTYKWTLKGPDTSTATLSADNVAKPTFKPDVKGDYTAKLVVTDKGQKASEPVEIKVKAAEVVARAAKDAETVAKGAELTLDGTSSGTAKGGTLTYAWTNQGTPAGELTNADKSKATFKAAAAGTYKVQLIVKDAAEESAPYVVTVTVTN
ncbi:PKD domain-containing protein [Pendulispora albinea]|uniref:PKD domain-containing protein n=1 Tax=Pendulispora albinea TaxID=2741071 RepID=A0ABZ2LVQ8_9BACT